MKVIIREKADQDLDAIFAWIARDNPRAATDMIRRIRVRVMQRWKSV
jgi:plasmid stabilization system protein ParE